VRCSCSEVYRPWPGTAYLWLIASAGSVRASLVTYLMPAFALVLGWAALGEEPGAPAFAGLAFICAGVASVMFGAALASSPWRAARGAFERARRTAGREPVRSTAPRPVYW
jgi:EamA domain-containing membrane protein RarD